MLFAIRPCFVRMQLLVYVAFFTIVWTTASVRAGPIVTTTLGRVEGITSRAHDGTPVDVFRGIPYALPPVGDLRWKTPSPAEPWNGVFDASQFGAACLQLDSNTLEIPSYGTYSEDCLTLNVYSPDVSTMAKTFPVMVWIHGGSFKTGTGSETMYEAEELVRKDVIVVTCNYRLSALGFLATEDEASPGNYGLLDQVLVLTWVRDNMAAFNGDVSRVTIFGTSSGGASVAMHMLSPLSDGLFHRAITQSGSSLASWSVEQDPLVVTLYVAELVNCPSANSSDLEAHRDMMDCLRQVNASELMMAQKYIEIWSPTVDEKFLPNMPLDLLTSGQYAKDVQLIIGTTKDEGIVFVPIYAGVGILNLTYEILAEELIPVQLEVAKYSDPTGVLAESVLFEYTNWNDPRGKGHLNDVSPNSNITNKEGEWNTIQSASEIIGDIMFKCPMQIEAALHASNGVPVYMYALEYVTDIYAGIPFVLHALEKVYVFGRPFKNNTFCSDAEAAICPHPDDYIEANERDRIFSDWMMDLWTNFAKKGDPTPGILGYGGVKWPKYAETLLSSTSRAYLRLDELSTTAQHFAARSSEYWHSYLYKLQNITASLPDGPATATTQAPSTETTVETTTYVTIGPVEPSEEDLWPLIWTLVVVGGAFLILAILEGVALILISKSVKTRSIDAGVYKNEVYHNEIYDM